MAAVQGIVSIKLDAKYDKSNQIQRVLSNADQNELELIRGYIVEHETNHQIVIPKDIINLIIVYFIEFEEWSLDLKSKDIILSHNNRCVHHNCGYYQDGNTTAWRSIYGTTICTKNKIYKWKLKIIKIDPDSGDGNSWKILVGIVESEKGELKLDKCFNQAQSYGFIGSIAGLSRGDDNWGHKFEEMGDTLTMVLNMRDLTLSYTINGTDYGIAYNINDGKYRLALSIADGRHIQLL